MGAEGYQKGKCYWEVEVGKRKRWLLGVIIESGATQDYCLQPTQDPYLVGIEMENGKLSAIHSPDAEVSLKRKCETVGIYLDYKSGSVSFYHVIDHSIIHHFVKNFKGTIYPFF